MNEITNITTLIMKPTVFYTPTKELVQAVIDRLQDRGYAGGAPPSAEIIKITPDSRMMSFSMDTELADRKVKSKEWQRGSLHRLFYTTKYEYKPVEENKSEIEKPTGERYFVVCLWHFSPKEEIGFTTLLYVTDGYFPSLAELIDEVNKDRHRPLIRPGLASISEISEKDAEVFTKNHITT